MTVDLRGFAYVLEPVKRKQQSQLEDLQHKLGKAQLAVDHAFKALLEIQHSHQQLCAAVHCVDSGSVDPAQYRHQLLYLAHLQDQIRDQRQLLALRQEERDALRLRCERQQQKVELSEQHRTQCLEDYQQLEQRRQSAEADRDWLVAVKPVANDLLAGEQV